MSRVPIIDAPCPFRVSNMPIDGHDHCGHCDRKVHNLDAMSSAQREVFLGGCSGKVCVAYTVHRRVMRRNVSLGIGLAAAVAGSAAIAGETPQEMHASNMTTTTELTEVSPSAAPEELDTIELIFVGGISNPTESRWSDESKLTHDDVDALPEISEMDWLPSKAL